MHIFIMLIRRDIKSLSLPEITSLRYSKALLFSDDAELARIANCMNFCMQKTVPSKYICTGHFSEYYRYNVDTPLRVVFNDDNLFKDDLLSRHATIRDLLSHRMGIPGNNAIRLDTNLTRENLIQ